MDFTIPRRDTMRSIRLFPLFAVLILAAGCSSSEASDLGSTGEAEMLARELDLALSGDTMISPVLNDAPAQKIEDELPVVVVDTVSASPAPAVLARRTTPRREQPRASETPSPVPNPSHHVVQPASVVAHAGTVFTVRLSNEVSSRTHSTGSSVEGYLADPLVDIRGRVVIPSGSAIHGRVTRAGTDGDLDVEFTSIASNGRSYVIGSSTLNVPVQRVSRTSHGRNVLKVGAGAAAGAMIGRALGRNDGATLAGALAGAAAGTAVVAATNEWDYVIPSGTLIRVRLETPVEVEI